MFPRMDAPPPPPPPASAGRSSRVSTWFGPAAVAVLVLLAGGGAAADPSGVRFGMPSFAVVALSALVAAIVRASGVLGVGWLLLPASAALLSTFLPAGASSLLLFSGAPLYTFVLAAIVLAIAGRGRKPPRSLLLPAFLAIYAAVAYQAQTRVGPDGDEPQYLMVAESLLRDHDLALDQDFKEARYNAFFSRPLDPHFRIRGPEGQIYSLHAVGLSLLILPAYALGGYAGASFFMALLAAFLIREVRGLVRELTGDDALAEGTAWIVGLSPPIIHFAGLIFTEIPAALLLCIGLRTAVFGRTPRASVVAALCVAALPWLNVRYAILSLAVFGALSWRLWREERATSAFPVRPLVTAGLLPAVSAVAISLYHFALWGFFDPRRVYGRRREFSLDVLPEGLPGLFFDQEFGLFIYAPIFVLSFAGFVHLWRKRPSMALAALVAVGGIVATASVWPMWRGGFNPPSRFLVPLISILAGGLALTLQRGVRSSTALLAGWSLWCGIGGAMNIETIHRDRDGVAPFFRTQSGAREWTAALPSFVLPEDQQTRALALPWALLLALPLVGAFRRPEAGAPRKPSREALLAVAAFMATAVIADRLSPRTRAPERDAVRLLGSSALLVPEFRFEGVSPAEWMIDFLHEPHRNPSGSLFARQVALRPGKFELILQTEDSFGVAVPTLRVVEHRTGGAASWEMRAEPQAQGATFEVRARAEFDFYLVGGAPGTFSGARLRRLPD